MQWDPSELVGFSESSPWIPIGPEPEKRNVETQRSEPESLLHLYRNLLALRKQRTSLRVGEYRSLDSSDDNVLVYLRWVDDESTSVAINFGSDAVQMNRLGDPLFTDGAYEPHGSLVFLGPGAIAIWDSTSPEPSGPLSSSR